MKHGSQQLFVFYQRSFFKPPDCGVMKLLPLISTTLPVTGLSEENKVQTPAFTDAVRLYRQAQGHYGTWEMMCGVPSQVSTAAQISCVYFFGVGMMSFSQV